MKPGKQELRRCAPLSRCISVAGERNRRLANSLSSDFDLRLMRPIRVAIVHYRDDATVGGSLRVGETTANNLDPARIEASLVFAYGEPGPVSEKAKVPVHHLRARSSRDLQSWFAARALFRKTRPDILHFVDPVNWLALATLG